MTEVMAAQQYVEQEQVLEPGLLSPPHHHHHTPITADDMPEKTVFLDNDQGEKVEWSISGNNPGLLHDLDAKLVDSDIGKVLNAFISAQDDEIKPHEDNHNTSSSTEREQVTNSAEEDYEEEVIELEFERAIKKLDTHTMHCPKCNNQVTKVILRRKIRTIRKEKKPLSLLGCLPCLSVFIPTGNYFNMFGIFGNDQGKKPQETPSLGASISPSDATINHPTIPTTNGNVIIQEKGGCFGLFGVFGKKNETESIKEPLLTSTADSGGSPSQPTHIDGTKVQVEQDQEQYSKQKDEGTSTGSSSYINGGLKGKHVVGTAPTGVILPGDVRLDIEDDLVVSTNLGGFGKPSGETDGSRDIDEATLLDQKTGVIEQPAHPSINQDSKSIEIVKSIVYGGLMETITSLSVVASAAASDITTLNIIALGLANLVGGIFIIAHNLWDLKDDHRSNPGANKYKQVLGRRENFPIHATLAILSFLIFGLISPVTYGFAFRVSDNKDYKILAVAGAALLSVVLLAIGKAYAQRTPKFHLYLKTIVYYVSTAFAVSGVSYAAGHLAKKFIEELGLFDTNTPVAQSFPAMNSWNPVLATY